MGGASPALRVGNGAGFWGDNLDAPFLLARDGGLDVLTLEYLAELTLAILSHLRTRDPSKGYVGDFPDLLPRLAPILRDQDRLKVVTNAGGLNPSACASVCARALVEAGLSETPLAVVDGDDVLGAIPGWLADGLRLDHMETGGPIDDVVSKLVSANAYLGARPIARGLSGGARVVLTGRVADASLTLGPAAAHFGWAWDDWPRLAGATVAGHVIECGAQATGGLWHRWDALPDLAGIGYPIAEVHDDGSTVLTKPSGTGGLVSVGTVSEQLVYEIDDPARYRTPDVDVDLTTVRLRQDGADRVAVSGAEGRPPSETLKVAAVYRDGWTASGLLAVVGRGAEAKARAAGRIVLERVKRAGFEPADALVECLGAGAVVPGVFPRAEPPWEVVLRVTVRDPVRAAVERFCREFAPLVTSGPPGIAGYASGRPTPRPAFGYWPTLVPRDRVAERVTVRTAADWAEGGGAMSVRVGDLAHARSGDKGDRANIGVVAFDADGYEWLARNLTEAVVSAYFQPMGVGTVRRYDLPNLRAFNFVIDRALGGGASRSLRIDSQGKALGVALLELRLPETEPPSPPPPAEERRTR